jgi:hypothetical protein
VSIRRLGEDGSKVMALADILAELARSATPPDLEFCAE